MSRVLVASPYTMPLPLPPPGTRLTDENVRKYSMLRPQYEYDGSEPFWCCRRHAARPRDEKNWGCWWPPVRPEPPFESSDDGSDFDLVAYVNLNNEEEFMSDTDDEYDNCDPAPALHVPRRRMSWLAGFASRSVPRYVA